MAAESEHRLYTRFPVPIPVAVIAPALSNLPLIPEDICASGLQLTISKEPDLNREVECSIRIHKDVFEGISAVPVWGRVFEDDPPTWIMGLKFELPEDKRGQLEKSLRQALG